MSQQLPQALETLPGRVIWLTGLPCAGKTTIAQHCVRLLQQRNIPVEHLDGDALRDVVQQTSFSAEARELHLRYVAFMASRLAAHHVQVFCSFVSPRQEHRDFARSLCQNFIELYVATSLETCEQRDVKGMYAKARRGEITNFTGVDGVYEPPHNPEVVIHTEASSAKASAQKVLELTLGIR